MTSLERYLNCIAGKSFDTVPRIPIVMQFAAEYINSNYAAFASDYKTLVEANSRCVEDFHFDQLSVISDPYRETQGFGARIEFRLDGVPKCIDPPLENSQDITRLRTPNPYKSVRMNDRIKAVTLFKERFKNKYSILGWVEGSAAEAADLRTVNNFLLDLLLDSQFAGDLMEVCTMVASDFAVAQIEKGADTIGIGDAIASQVSTDVYEKMIQPREKKIIEKIHQAGAYARLHICGDISHLLEGISDLGVDILDVDHMVDMRRVRKIVGDDVVLAGNIDPVHSVRMGSPANIKKIIRRTYDDVGNPFMVNAGCEIPSGTPLENLHALCEPIDFIG